jgi:hypothetical protein
MHLLDILRNCWINQNCRYDVAGADAFPGEGVATYTIEDSMGILVLIDHLHRHEAPASIGQRYRHGPSIKIEHGRRLERVAIEADHELLVERCGFARKGVVSIVENRSVLIRNEQRAPLCIRLLHDQLWSSTTALSRPTALRTGIRCNCTGPGNSWKVHHYTTEMDRYAWMQEEEQAFLENPSAVFSNAHCDALSAIRDAVGLEFFGIDCALDRDGEIVVFEVNASMLVHDDNADFPHKAPHCRHIRAVYETMLARAGQRARQFQAA